MHAWFSSTSGDHCKSSWSEIWKYFASGNIVNIRFLFVIVEYYWCVYLQGFPLEYEESMLTSVLGQFATYIDEVNLFVVLFVYDLCHLDQPWVWLAVKTRASKQTHSVLLLPYVCGSTVLVREINVSATLCPWRALFFYIVILFCYNYWKDDVLNGEGKELTTLKKVGPYCQRKKTDMAWAPLAHGRWHFITKASCYWEVDTTKLNEEDQERVG